MRTECGGHQFPLNACLGMLLSVPAYSLASLLRGIPPLLAEHWVVQRQQCDILTAKHFEVEVDGGSLLCTGTLWGSLAFC